VPVRLQSRTGCRLPSGSGESLDAIARFDAAGRIVNIEDMAPQTETIHWSGAPSLYALEVRKGWFRDRGIKPGDRIEGLP